MSASARIHRHAEPVWLREARKLVGLKEAPGKANNPKVLQLYKEAGHAWVKEDAVAWCAAFASAMLERAGVKSPKTLRARDFLEWGQELREPRLGAIVVFKRGRNPRQGHVAFYLGETAKFIEVIGGNQRDAVSIKRYAKSKWLGYRWPAEVDVPDRSDRQRDRDQSAELRQGLLRFGSKGWRVRQMQERLRELGYTQVGRADGDFGRATRAAVLDFQANAGLATDGIVGPATWRALDTAKRRPVTTARAETTVEELAQESRIAGEATRARRDAAFTVGGTVATAGAAVADKVSDATDTVDRVNYTAERSLDVFERLTGGALSLEIIVGLGLLGVVVFAFVMWRRSGKIIAARLEDHRTGRTG